jgi:nuclear pore complex protein Nup93
MQNHSPSNPLQIIAALDILPLKARGNSSVIRNLATKFASLSQPVAHNVPNLLMWTIISCNRQRANLASTQFGGNEGTRQSMIDDLKQVNMDLTTYTSQLRYRFPAHLHELLARAQSE